MKRARKAEGRANKSAGNMTGRDGAIDYVIKSEALNRGADAEDHVYRVIEVVGTSRDSIEGAIKAGVDRAHQTIRNLRWFEVAKTSGHIERGTVSHFQVTLKVGFTMENAR